MLATNPANNDSKHLLTNRNNLQIVRLSPVDEPVCQGGDSALVSLVHEGDVAVAGGAGLLELLLALLRRLVVPVARVDVVRDHRVVHLLHHAEELPARLQVRRPHVLRLLAHQVHERLLHLLHLALDLRRAHAAHVRVRPFGTGSSRVSWTWETR